MQAVGRDACSSGTPPRSSRRDRNAYETAKAVRHDTWVLETPADLGCSDRLVDEEEQDESDEHAEGLRHGVQS